MDELLLIDGLERRDKVVFDYVFHLYYSSLCAFAMQYLNDRDLCEDLVQDFFTFLWSNASGLHIKSSLKSYLFTSIKNRCIDLQKHKRVINKFRDYQLFSTNQNDNSADFYYTESELRLAIEKSLKKLSPRCREIFKLSRLKGLSNQEIAEQTGISKRTVELHISNSLKILRKELFEYLHLWLAVCFVGRFVCYLLR